MTEAEMQDVADMVVEAIRDELARVLPVFAEMVAREIRRLENAPPANMTEHERVMALTIGRIYRDQGGRPVPTKAVAVRLGYSPQHMLTLLKQAEDKEVVSSIPGRGNRHSGRWIPITAAA